MEKNPKNSSSFDDNLNVNENEEAPMRKGSSEDLGDRHPNGPTNGNTNNLSAATKSWSPSGPSRSPSQSQIKRNYMSVVTSPRGRQSLEKNIDQSPPTSPRYRSSKKILEELKEANDEVTEQTEMKENEETARRRFRCGMFRKKAAEGATPRHEGNEEYEEFVLFRKKFFSRLENILQQRQADLLAEARTFIPQVIETAMFQGTLPDDPQVNAEVYRCTGCVVFSDASGFTALTEQLAKKNNGAEILSKCLNKFFTPLIDIITAYRGDVIKFSGDALTILFDSFDDNEKYFSACGTPSCNHTPFELCCFRAAACCLEIHRRLHNFETGEGDVKLTLHIGVGAGAVRILQVGGQSDRFEYVIAGKPLEQISIAEPLASSGETVFSPEAWEKVKKYVVEGEPIPERPTFHRLAALDISKHTFPTVKHAAQQTSTGLQKVPRERISSTLNYCRRFIPRAVLLNYESGTSSNINEMRAVSIIFVQIQGVDVASDDGMYVAQALMKGMQLSCYREEGNVNKFLVDDKGLLFLLVFGLPPLVHVDDPARAVRTCKAMLRNLEQLKLRGRFGITTGRVFCGVVGSDSRREYTVMGDTVNLSARLMGNAKENSVLVDFATYDRCKSEIVFEELPSINVKGKKDKINIFAPVFDKSDASAAAAIKQTVIPLKHSPVSLKIPWPSRSCIFGGSSKLVELKAWQPYQLLKQKLEGPDGLLAKGGVVLISGQSAEGKEDLCEAALHMGIQGKFVPLCSRFYSDINRPLRDIFEGALQLLNPSLSLSNGPAVMEAVTRVVGELTAVERVWMANLGYQKPQVEEFTPEEQDIGKLKLINRVLDLASEAYPIVIMLRWRVGTSIYAIDQSMFWRSAKSMATLISNRPSNRKPILLIVMVRNENNQMIDVKDVAYIPVGPLNSDGVKEHINVCLGLHPDGDLPEDLIRFVEDATLNVPLYIVETLEQLKKEKLIVINHDECQVMVSNLHDVNIAEWNHTCMVGQLSAKLESLGPIRNSVLKMVSVFDNAFSSLDLVAATRATLSTTSKGLSAFCVSARMLAGTSWLVQKGYLKKVPVQLLEGGVTADGASEEVPRWTISNYLIRKVAKSMILHTLSQLIKRQVLMQRRIYVNLPARLKERALKLKEITGETSGKKKGKGFDSKKYEPLEVEMGKMPSRIVHRTDELLAVKQQRLVDLEEHNARVQIPKEESMPAMVPEKSDGNENNNETTLGFIIPKSVEGVSMEKAFDLCYEGDTVGLMAFIEELEKSNPKKIQSFPRFQDANGMTMLHFACFSGDLDLCKMLVGMKCSVEAQSHEGIFPINMAALYGHNNVVTWLIKDHNALNTSPQFRVAGYWESFLPDIQTANDIPAPITPVFFQHWEEDPEESLRVAKVGRKMIREYFAARLVESENIAPEEVEQKPAETYIRKQRRARLRVRISLWTQLRRTVCGNERRRNETIKFLTRSKIFRRIVVVCVLFSLFAPDAFELTEVGTNTPLDICVLFIFIVFAFQWLGLCLTDAATNYIGTFYFYADFVSTFALLFDISFVFGQDAGTKKQSNSDNEGSTYIRDQIYPRTVTMIARTCRLLRIPRYFRFLTSTDIKADTSSDMGSDITSQLTVILSTRVALLTILLALVVRTLSILSYPNDDFSSRCFVNNLARVDKYGRADPSPKWTALYEKEISALESWHVGMEYGPFQVCKKVDGEWQEGEECRALTPHRVNATPFGLPRRLSHCLEVIKDNIKISFDMTEVEQFSSSMAIGLYATLLFIMTFTSLLQTHTVLELAVRPLQRILATASSVAEQVFESVKTIESQKGGKNGNEMDHEMSLEADNAVRSLERVVEKLATVAELAMKPKIDVDWDSNVIAQQEAGMYEIWGTPVTSKQPDNSNISRVIASHRRADDDKDRFGEIGKWSYDFLALDTDEERTKTILYIVTHNPGSSEWLAETVDNECLKNFFLEVQKDYDQKQPYHTWTHGCDVAHAVFIYYLAIKVEMFLSPLEQFSILISACAHDIGHFGINNPFLMETGHKLAILYNDQSPLENMHCARLFEICKSPKSNIFSNLSRNPYKEARRLCIEVILHTDMINHFPMVKQLSMLYELNPAVFDAAMFDPNNPKETNYGHTKQELALFADEETKFLICQLLLHSADVSNPCKSWDVCYEWSLKVLAEFFAQGDLEKKLRMPIGILNDRDHVNTPKSQIGFMEFIVSPLITVEIRILPQLHFKAQHLTQNLNRWQNMWINKSHPAPSKKEKDDTDQRIQKLSGMLDNARSRIIVSEQNYPSRR